LTPDQADQLSVTTIDRLLDDAKAGKMFILMDDRDGSSTGDLCILAEHCDNKAVNAMLKHAAASFVLR